MPPGIPVATMAVNGAKNAGILAARILGVADPDVSAMIESYMGSLKDMVDEKSAALNEIGYKDYLTLTGHLKG